MIEQFNRILKAFGANRVELQGVNEFYIQFRIVGWAAFEIRQDGRLLERTELSLYGGYGESNRSRWLHAISLGKKRNEEGVIV